MEQYELTELLIAQQQQDYTLHFSSAQLVVVTELGSRLWYIDVNGIAETELLESFSRSENIRIELQAVTAGGRRYEGIGYLHPNPAHQAAAIRGDGELAGF
ncbi:hypothetical protein IDH44_25035 [Paenibacillus sp. IB182496]|uniref:Uncharacterized protein n=1 Tax=Paenibacillus sabuli TaxID=2772509 RepID=A0A927GUS0_9BACL|nr:hypothetical protein [Paenibacillus sabuli]MBD2848460.1 hypothetical protein [Paenibacillus sabuli]